MKQPSNSGLIQYHSDTIPLPVNRMQGDFELFFRKRKVTTHILQTRLYKETFAVQKVSEFLAYVKKMLYLCARFWKTEKTDGK